MSMLALTTAAVLLVASPASAGAAPSDAVQLAATGGFLLGNAHRCGIQIDRVVRAGHLIRNLITAAARDTDEEDDATAKFSQAFLSQAFPEMGKGKLVASCPLVSSELIKLERHQASIGDTTVASGSSGTGRIRLSDGD